MTLNRDIDAQAAEARSLQEYCEGLREAIDEFEHEARRCRERLERVGGDSHQLARELARLERNRKDNRKALEQARRRLDELRRSVGDAP